MFARYAAVKVKVTILTLIGAYLIKADLSTSRLVLGKLHTFHRHFPMSLVEMNWRARR